MKKLLGILSISTIKLAIVSSAIICKIDQNSNSLELGLDQSIYKLISKTSERTDADKIKDAIEALNKIESDEIQCPSSYVNGEYCSMIWDIKCAIKNSVKYTNAIKEVNLKEDLSLELKLKTKSSCLNKETEKLTLYDWVSFDEVIFVKGTVQSGTEEKIFKFAVKIKELSVLKVKMRDGVWKI